MGVVEERLFAIPRDEDVVGDFTGAQFIVRPVEQPVVGARGAPPCIAVLGVRDEEGVGDEGEAAAPVPDQAVLSRRSY